MLELNLCVVVDVIVTVHACQGGLRKLSVVSWSHLFSVVLEPNRVSSVWTF